MPKTNSFKWPPGKRAAISLTFDDARLSQIDCGTPILDAHDVRATFYVSPGAVEKRLDGWRRAIAKGHEIGNHTISHPCTGNFPWSRANALEDYTLKRMEAELTGASAAIRKALGVVPKTFAYPCGQKFVGRAKLVKSYVPLVARHFLAGRGFPDETFNDPIFCDLAQLAGQNADGVSFEQFKLLINQAADAGGWVIFVGHEVGDAERQCVASSVLEALCQYARDPVNGLWIDTVEAIAIHVLEARKGNERSHSRESGNPLRRA